MMSFAVIFLAATFTRPMERVASMDPAMCRSVYDSHALQLVYETPLEIDYLSRPYRLVPGFCELPEVSGDGLEYVFRLRSQTRLAAEDMVRALKALNDPNRVSPNGWIVKDVAAVTARDSRTVVIRLRRPVHYFPWMLAMSPTAARLPDGSGTGEYRLERWWKNHEMVFRRKTPTSRGFDEVRYLVIDDMTTQWLMFLKGEIDFMGEISRDNWDSIIGANGRLSPDLERAGVKLHSMPTLEVMYVGINMRDPVLGPNRPLRQALNAAFDFDRWDEFYNHRIVECNGPLPFGIEGRLTTRAPYAYDLEKARRLMVEAGYPGGIDPKTSRRLILTMSIGRASQESREAGELMASFYERIGIKLELEFMTWDAFMKAVNDGRSQLFRMGWVGDYPDAQNFLQLFHSKNQSPGPNHGNYANADFDREYEAAIQSRTAAERNVHWAQCQEIIREDCPWIFTHFNRAYSLTRPRVGNYHPTDFPYGVEKHYENTVP